MSGVIKKSFEDLVIENGKDIFHYIYSYIKHKELTEDLYQEVLLSAYLAFPALKEESKYRSWLFKIAMNKCRDYWRKEKKRKQFWTEDVYSYSASFNPPSLPEEKVIGRISSEQIVDKVNRLPEIYRKPIMLYYYQDLTLLEIASKNDLPMSTVKTRMKRAKERLRPKVQSLA